VNEKKLKNKKNTVTKVTGLNKRRIAKGLVHLLQCVFLFAAGVFPIAASTLTN
jgi:hypothetical protein